MLYVSLNVSERRVHSHTGSGLVQMNRYLVQIVFNPCTSCLAPEDAMAAVHSCDAYVCSLLILQGLGPGVYDIHSPIVPTVEAMADKLRRFLQVPRQDATTKYILATVVSVCTPSVAISTCK